MKVLLFIAITFAVIFIGLGFSHQPTVKPKKLDFNEWLLKNHHLIIYNQGHPHVIKWPDEKPTKGE